MGTKIGSYSYTLLRNNKNPTKSNKEMDSFPLTNKLDQWRKKRSLFLLLPALSFVLISYSYYSENYFVRYDKRIDSLPRVYIFKNILQNSTPVLSTEEEEVPIPPSGFLVKNQGCSLISMNKFDNSVKKFWKPNYPKKKCESSLVKLVNKNKLILDNDAMKNSKKFQKFDNIDCCYREIMRVQQNPKDYNMDADYSVAYSHDCIHIPKNGVTLRKEKYVKIECSLKEKYKKVQIWTDFHAIVQPPQNLSGETKEKLKFWENYKNHSKDLKMPPSILVIGIDSISRLHMLRSMPITKKFLDSQNFIQLKGYTKVGENTFPNMMAGFAGMKNGKYDACWKSNKMKLDNCPFIWKNFSSELKYLTAHVEDSPALAIFNYNKAGFVLPPSDYYPRPVLVAEHKFHNRNRGSGSNDCIGGSLTPTQFLMKYISSFLDHVESTSIPFFLLSWFTSVAHDEFMGLKNYDQEFADFLQESLDKVGESSVVLFISDHGYRFGEFRETFLGFYEESLPFFYVRLPQYLKEEKPKWYRNLRINSHRLTSPFDLYSTLLQIFQYSKKKHFPQNNNNSKTEEDATFGSPSFFELGGLNRTCESSNVPQQYCVCGVSPDISKTNKKSQEIGKYVVSKININLKNFTGKCLTLEYGKFLYGREVGKGDKWNNFGKLESYQDYLLGFETTPWDARFEARVRVFGGKMEVLGTVNRINSYEGRSDCISDYLIKNYCLCTNLWRKSEEDKKKKG